MKEVKDGTTSIKDALAEFQSMPFHDMGFVKIDTHRELRKGIPEVVFCEGKTKEQITAIFAAARKNSYIMATRADEEIFRAVKNVRKDADFYVEAGIIFAGRKKRRAGKKVLVVTAGTSDIPVAEEAAVTCELTGNNVERIFDIGVAGVHRLLSNSKKLMSANVIVVVAGMDGALPSIVGGMVSCPVVAVPTSVGYGANFKGLAPLLTMLNSCAPGISVVNIDNGFGAGYLAGLINKRNTG